MSKIGAYGLIFLFVCLNLGAYLLNEFQVLGFPVVRWVIGGFPLFLSQLGAPTEIVLVISVLTGIVWFWTLFSVLSGRAVERE